MPHVPHVPRPRVPGIDGRSLRWESHNAERREQVLAAAVELLEEQPPGAEIHVQQIAERAGLARTVVYRLFNSRADLQRAVQLRVVEMIRGVLEVNFELTGSADEIIRGIVGSYVDWVAEHPQLHDMAERELGDGEPGELERAIDVLGKELSELLQAGAALLDNDLDDTLIAMLDLLVVGLIGQVRGAVNQWVRRPDRTPSARTLTGLLSRWIWYQIDGQARELGVVVDPTRPIEQARV
ncbi:TetR/AcrR family transcriptional regulator [Nocardioides panacisoli]|uniref:TetR/AcrR family transcriptional regulator n=1 Tax=Nocardioides panacisoli TaxID=627624 RepID=A0ABP7J085_9ACTN